MPLGTNPTHTHTRHTRHNNTRSHSTHQTHTIAEAEHRSTFYIPYWNIALLRALVPRQRAFAADMVVRGRIPACSPCVHACAGCSFACARSGPLHMHATPVHSPMSVMRVVTTATPPPMSAMQVINATLDDLIKGARATREEDDFEALQARDYSKVGRGVGRVDEGDMCVTQCLSIFGVNMSRGTESIGHLPTNSNQLQPNPTDPAPPGQGPLPPAVPGGHEGGGRDGQAAAGRPDGGREHAFGWEAVDA